MKLIIDIPEDLYKGIECRNPELETEYVCDELMKAVDNSVPLDDVKAEISNLDRHKENYSCVFNRPDLIDLVVDDVLHILDNIGKAESEEDDGKKA